MPTDSGCRLRLEFNSAQRIRACGWSETYDMGYASLAAAVAGQTNIQAFIRDRVYLLGRGVVLQSATLTAITPPSAPGAPPVRRDTLEIQVPPEPDFGSCYNPSFPSGTDPRFKADFGTTVFYIRVQTNFTATPVYSRNIWIAGLPDGSDEIDSNTVTDGLVLPALQTFLNDLKNAGGGPAANNSISIKSSDRSLGNPVKNCTAWNTSVATYTVPAHGFVQYQPISAIGCKTNPGGFCPRGRYLVGAVIDANTISLMGAGPPDPPKKLGGFRAVKTVFTPIQGAIPNGFTKRDKGRPFGESVGRRKTPLIKRA